MYKNFYIPQLPGRRGIRLDFYVIDGQGRIYDVEMQKRNRGNIPKRTRFYQAIVDAQGADGGGTYDDGGA